MIKDRTILVEYEEYLIGNKSRLSTEFIGYTMQKQEALKDLLRFIFSDILRWSPDMVKAYISQDILNQLKAGNLVKYLDFPIELEKDKDLFYLATILYPREVKYNHKDRVIHTYTGVLNQTRKKFPADFFSDADGRLNFSICLNYYLSSGRDTQMIFSTMEDAYNLFADDKKANALLSKAKLLAPCRALYENPLEMLHDILPSFQRDEFLYMERRFNKAFVKAERIYNKNKAAEEKEGGSI